METLYMKSVHVLTKLTRARGVIGLTRRIPAGAFLLLASVSQAQDLGDQRSGARNELAPLYFNKFIEIESTLIESTGPERWTTLFGKPIVGCPSQTRTPADTLNIDFSTSGPQSWAGDLDGINLETTTVAGLSGGALAVPSNSTARVQEGPGRPELTFSFDATNNVVRAAIDRANREIDRCLSNLPPGNYPGDEISRLCPYPEIPVSQLQQTCVYNTYGTIGERLADGSGYKVTVLDQMLCDGVGYGRAQPRNTGWIGCYTNTYEGVAKITAGRGGESVAARRAAVKNAMRKCAVAKGKNAHRKVGRCAARRIAQSMAGAV